MRQPLPRCPYRDSSACISSPTRNDTVHYGQAGADSGQTYTQCTVYLRFLRRATPAQIAMLSRLRFLRDVSPPTVIARAAIGVLIAVLGVIARVALDPILDEQVPFAIAFGAGIAATLVAGMAGGIGAVVASACMVDFAVVSPRYQITILEHAPATTLFVVVSLVLVWQVDRLRTTEAALRVSETRARQR